MWLTASMTSSPSSGTPRPRPVAALLLGAVGLAYPFIVYAALGRVPAGAVVLVALALIAARFSLMRGAAPARTLVPVMLAVAAATGALALADSRLAAMAYPVLMSLGMAAAFGLSLRSGPSLIETFASLKDADPGPAARRYMRRLSLVWCLFLLANAAVSAATIALGDAMVWALYNGLISYVLMGLLLAGEYALRRRVLGRAGAR